MKIKRFVAQDMRTALQMVRAEHGPDAVILSNRRTDDGVEIVAASNYDEAMVQRALDTARSEPAAPQATAPQRAVFPLPDTAPVDAFAALRGRDAAPAAAAMPQPRPAPPPVRSVDPAPEFAAALAAARVPTAADVASAPVHAPADVPAPAFADVPAAPAPQPVEAAAPTPVAAPAPPPVSAASDEQLMEMRNELSQMRQMIEREMARLTDERLRGSPVRAQAMELMDDYGFDAGITRDVALQIPADTEAHRGRGLMLGLISKRLPICPVDPLHEAGVIALVGPTGAGKTTTIAKLAALYASQHQARDVALVTTDTTRIGGREQLYSYGRQLGIAVHEADSEAGLLQLLQRLQDYRLVLVDTAGLSQRDRALAGQLNWLRAARQVRTLLVLPANSHHADLDEVVRRFHGARPQGVVLTKLDETGRLGSALSTVVDHELPLTWITDGQQVPGDLHRANAAHLVLRLEDLRRAADRPNSPELDHVVA
ncbi:flagellar biosynthesis protein FlhF [Luteimonas sp. SJ-92]|uniref:Flagellar biosynthesis protein FlhF n=1 Tax=Luteimonas salinisoli TaxID=2752307 RepID=A0A853JEW6_9GAMM|nr:flagellar biosynthesis protein FlhF [Luteimonas salinisoli]NZA27883.1 flagellar biosynthesis protein FlhF [Luteimonas salinisoli]